VGAEAFICDAVRTPIGRYGGALAHVRTDDLATVPLKALMARHPKVDWSKLDEVYLGCANQAGEDNRNVARMALLLSGLPESDPFRRDILCHRRRGGEHEPSAAGDGQGRGGVPALCRDP
jgi:acetyl-CoA acetyltransferase